MCTSVHVRDSCQHVVYQLLRLACAETGHAVLLPQGKSRRTVKVYRRSALKSMLPYQTRRTRKETGQTYKYDQVQLTVVRRCCDSHHAATNALQKDGVRGSRDVLCSSARCRQHLVALTPIRRLGISQSQRPLANAKYTRFEDTVFPATPHPHRGKWSTSTSRQYHSSATAHMYLHGIQLPRASCSNAGTPPPGGSTAGLRR